MEKLELDELSNVSSGIYDPNGNAIKCQNCGTLYGLVGIDRTIDGRHLIRWGCARCGTAFFTDYKTGEYVDVVEE